MLYAIHLPYPIVKVNHNSKEDIFDVPPRLEYDDKNTFRDKGDLCDYGKFKTA